MAETKTKNKGGRPSKYDPIFCDKIIEFFSLEPINYKDVTYTYKNGDTVEKSEEEAATLPFLSDFAKSIGIDRDTLKDWAKDDKKYPGFPSAYKRAKELQMQFLMVNGLRGNYSQAMAIFTLKNVSRWRDEEDQSWADKFEHTGKDGGPMEIKGIKVTFGK